MCLVFAGTDYPICPDARPMSFESILRVGVGLRGTGLEVKHDSPGPELKS